MEDRHLAHVLLHNRHHHHQNHSSRLVGNPNIPPDAPYPYSSLQIFGLFLLVLFPLLSSVTCALRLYSKSLVGRPKTDDWIMCMAVLLAIIQAGLQFIFVRRGFIGIHDYEIPLHRKGDSNLANYLAQIVYMPILSLVKISALLFFLQLGGSKPYLRIGMLVLLGLHISQAIIHPITVTFECYPISAVWDPAVRGSCLDAGAYSMFMSSFNIVTDLLVLLLPSIILRDLRLNQRIRKVLLGVFMLGIMTTILSIVRLYYVYQAFYERPGPDASYSISFLVTTAETNSAIVTASAPALWPLARRIAPRLFEQLRIDRLHDPNMEIGVETWRSAPGAPDKKYRVTRTKKGADPGRASAGVFATHTIGGTSFAMKTLDSDEPTSEGSAAGNTRRGSVATHTRALPAARIRFDSDEDMMQTYHEIMRETEVAAHHRETASAAGLDMPSRIRNSGEHTRATESRGGDSIDARPASPSSELR